MQSSGSFQYALVFIPHLNIAELCWYLPPHAVYCAIRFKIAEVRKHPCQFIKGDWCKKFWNQQGLPYKPVPRGNKECKDNCNNVGTCNYDIGVCLCPVGG